MAKRYFGFFDVDDKRYMLFEGSNNEVFYHIPNLTSDKYTTVDDEIVFRVVQELQKKRCVAVETISCDGNLIDVKLNLFTKKFWFVNQESGVRIPYEKCSLLYDNITHQWLLFLIKVIGILLGKMRMQIMILKMIR